VGITLTKTVILTTAALGAATSLGCNTFRPLSDDENPIRVRNEQLRIETYERDWVPVGNTGKWRINNGNPTESTEYTVTVYGSKPESNCNGVMRAPNVDVEYAIPRPSGQSPDLRTFKFAIESPNPSGGRKVPILTPSVRMTPDNSHNWKILRMEQDDVGAISHVVIGGKTCDFPGDRRVEVELCVHNCS
jgi:hypothetical protein